MSKLLFTKVSVEQQEIVVGGAVTTSSVSSVSSVSGLSSLSSLSQFLGPTTLTYITSYLNSAKIPAISPILSQLGTDFSSIGL